MKKLGDQEHNREAPGSLWPKPFRSFGEQVTVRESLGCSAGLQPGLLGFWVAREGIWSREAFS